ncbi:MAG: 2-C-methyl-D-erythritol 4-phosphate cytidylyltransferase [Deltaproteobacteria bacterium]|nr:2-C-methyl-D-erythritol 4-phosphate cytidylyltransferase [Deltaproteobacteria bacterium]
MTEKSNDMEARGAVAIIPAAGKGVRMGDGPYKQFLELDGKPILGLTLEKIQACPSIQAIIVVAPPDQVDYCRRKVIEPWGIEKVEKVVTGGQRRQDSVRAGLEASGGRYDIVVIHDGVRPLVATELIETMVSSAKRHRALIAAIPAKDTIKEVGERGLVARTHHRECLWMAQTPQVFRFEDIMEAHYEAQRKGWGDVTDDAQLVEKMGIAVKVIKGSEMNIKVTTHEDFIVARCLLELTKGQDHQGNR